MQLLTQPGRPGWWEAIPTAGPVMPMCTVRVMFMSESYYCSYVTG